MQLIASAFYILAPLYAAGADPAAEAVLQYLSVELLARIWPLICYALKGCRPPPRLPNALIENCLEIWDDSDFFEANGWPAKILNQSQASRIASQLCSNPRLLLQFHSDWRRYFCKNNPDSFRTYGPRIDPSSNFPVDVRFSEVWTGAAQHKEKIGFYRETCSRFEVISMCVKINPKRNVLAVVTSSKKHFKSFAVYAYGDGVERSNVGQLLYNYVDSMTNSELVAEHEAFEYERDAAGKPETSNILNISWSPDGNFLAVVQSAWRLQTTQKILFFGFDRFSHFKMLDFTSPLPKFGNILWAPWADAGLHNLWIGPREYLLPSPKGPYKIEFSTHQSGVAATISLAQRIPKLFLSTIKTDHSKCFSRPFYESEENRKNGNAFHVTGHQPSLYCLTEDGKFLISVEHCPDSGNITTGEKKTHTPHSSIAFASQISPKRKGFIIFRDWFVQDVTTLRSHSNCLLVLLTKEFECGPEPEEHLNSSFTDSDESDVAHARRKVRKHEEEREIKESEWSACKDEEKSVTYVGWRPKNKKKEKDDESGPSPICAWGNDKKPQAFGTRRKGKPEDFRPRRVHKLQNSDYYVHTKLVKITFEDVNDDDDDDDDVDDDDNDDYQPPVETLSLHFVGKTSKIGHHEEGCPHMVMTAQTETLVIVKMTSCCPTSVKNWSNVLVLSKICNAFEDATTHDGYPMPSNDLKYFCILPHLYTRANECSIGCVYQLDLWKCFEAGHGRDQLERDRRQKSHQLLQYNSPTKTILITKK